MEFSSMYQVHIGVSTEGYKDKAYLAPVLQEVLV